MRTVQRIEQAVIGTKVDSWTNDHWRGHQGASGLKLPQPCARQGVAGIQVAGSITDVECLGGYCWCGEHPAGRLPGGKTPPTAGLAGRPRHRELPDPELGPDQLEFILPGELTRLGCYRVYLSSRGEIDQSVGDDWRVLQTLAGAKPQPGVPCPRMQRVETPLR